MYHIQNDVFGKAIIKKENDTTYIIPFADDNTDYQEYLKWVSEGNVAEEITNGN